MSIVWMGVVVWLLGWGLNVYLVRRGGGIGSYVVPCVFGVCLLVLWESVVRGFSIPSVLLPSPSAIGVVFVGSLKVLWIDFVQTALKGALSGYIMGCVAAFVVALCVEGSMFLKRGLLPIGHFMAALPIIGLAPILVMWFGFDWESKAAVVVAMVFFPVLVNTVEGFRATDKMQRDLMRTYGSGYGSTMWRLRIPVAMPFIFNGLKIASTLALIGAIVAEFFGSPVRGMGFRISTSVGQLNLELVWAEIVVAALAGTFYYGVIAYVERKVTFWHPSQRGKT